MGICNNADITCWGACPYEKEEKKEWEEMDPEDRSTSFLPRKFDSLRQVGSCYIVL